MSQPDSQDSVSSSATTISVASSISSTPSSPSISKKRKAPPTQSATHLYEFVPNQTASKLLKCQICLDIVKNPVIHKDCGNILCTRCFGQVCPMCNHSTRNAFSRIPPDLINELGELKVECQNCKQTMPQRSFDNHLDHHCKLKCEKCQMEFTGDLKRAVHMETDCGFRIVSCKGAKVENEHKCSWKGPANQQFDHEEICWYVSLCFFQSDARKALENARQIKEKLDEHRYQIYFKEADNQINSEEAHKISNFSRIHRSFFYGSHACLVYKDKSDKSIHEHINYELDLNTDTESSINFPKRLYKLSDRDVYYIIPHPTRPLLRPFETVHPNGKISTPITLASFAPPAIRPASSISSASSNSFISLSTLPRVV